METNDFDNLNFDADASHPTPEPAPAPEEDFFPAEGAGFSLPDPQAVVTLRSTNGSERYVPVAEATPLSEIIATSGLSISGPVAYYLNNAQIDLRTPVAPGSTVTIMGTVKGG
jgi:hypothetical protein